MGRHDEALYQFNSIMTKDKTSFISAVLTAAMISAVVCVPASGETAPSFLNGKRAVQLYGNTAYFGEGKTDLAYPVIMKNENALLSESDFEALFGVNVSRLGTKISIGGGVKMTVGEDSFTYKGKTYELSAAPETDNGILYLPIEEYGENICTGGYITDGHGMVVTGVSEGTYNDLKDANLYLFFERKSPTELKTEFLVSTENGKKHPRLIASSEDFARIAKEIKTDKVKSEWYSQVLYTANSILKEAVPKYEISNGRLLDVGNGALLRVQYLGFVYQVTKNTKYSDRGIKELEAICGFSDWHPEHYLDTGTLAQAAAIGYDWLYEAMTPQQRESIAKKAQALALDTARKAYEGNADFNDFWVDTETNWGIVCNGGIANLALATGEYNTDSAMEVLSYALRSIEHPWYRFAPDGAWFEGPNYWSYLLTHLSLFMSGYESVMGETFGNEFMGLDKYGYFQVHIMGPDGLPNNFHDADEDIVQSDGQFYIADLYDDRSLMEYRIGFMNRYSVKPSAMDLIWCHAGFSGDMSFAELETDSYFRETELVSMRSGWENDSAWLSFHGGYSDNAHDHVDPGTFVYCAGGIRWATDLGKEPLSYVPDSENPSILAGYNSKYFYRRKGEGHNIVVINPDNKLETDISAFAEVTAPVTGSDGSFSTINLSKPYAAKVKSYFRGYKLSDNKKTLTIRDEISLKRNSELHWYMHTKGKIEIIDNNTACITRNGKKLMMYFAVSGGDAVLRSAAAKSLSTTPQFTNTENTGISKIDYLVNGSGNVDITVKMCLLGDVGDNSDIDTTPISQWSSEMLEKPITEDSINLYINDVKTENKLSSGLLKAEAVLADKTAKSEVKLIMAVYRNDILESVDFAEEKISGKLSIEKQMNDTENAQVKLMLWNGEMTPYLKTNIYK